MLLLLQFLCKIKQQISAICVYLLSVHVFWLGLRVVVLVVNFRLLLLFYVGLLVGFLLRCSLDLVIFQNSLVWILMHIWILVVTWHVLVWGFFTFFFFKPRTGLFLWLFIRIVLFRSNRLAILNVAHVIGGLSWHAVIVEASHVLVWVRLALSLWLRLFILTSDRTLVLVRLVLLRISLLLIVIALC